MPKPTAAVNAPAMPDATRRAFIKASAALGSVAALAAPVAILPKAEAATLDPVFPAIAALNEAWAGVETLVEDQAFYERAGQKVPAALERRIKAQHERCDEVRAALLSTMPTTKRGMLALLDVVDTPAGWFGCLMSDEETDAFMGTVRSFIAGGAHV